MAVFVVQSKSFLGQQTEISIVNDNYKIIKTRKTDVNIFEYFARLREYSSRNE